MGQLKASNRNDSWLTRLINMEYWLACNEEGAAQTRFGAVMCCCGPCAMYRRAALMLLLDQYETQFFRGKPSDFGEDRHLTILMLKAGVPNRVRSGRHRRHGGPGHALAVSAPTAPLGTQHLPRHAARFAPAARPRPDSRSTRSDRTSGRCCSPTAALAQLALTGTVPWWTALAIIAMTMIRCSVAAVRAGELRFLGFSLHTPINIFLLLR
ncbi:hypothetical protein ACVIN2_002890 [Bradyrhizobium sp. USDA 3650]